MEFPINELIPPILAALLGGIVGVERQFKGRGAGLRTHMMVSLASAIFILASREMTAQSTTDLTRVIQGIAAGVGFIGAGTILKLSPEQEVLGLTTASTIWLAAAVGTACGLNEYFLAATATVLAVFFLVLLRPVENYFGRKTKNRKSNETTNPAQKIN